MAAKKITEFLDKPEKIEESFVQGYVPASLKAQVKAQMQRDKDDGVKINWDILLEAACRAYLSERKLK